MLARDRCEIETEDLVGLEKDIEARGVRDVRIDRAAV